MIQNEEALGQFRGTYNIYCGLQSGEIEKFQYELFENGVKYKRSGVYEIGGWINSMQFGDERLIAIGTKKNLTLIDDNSKIIEKHMDRSEINCVEKHR